MNVSTNRAVDQLSAEERARLETLASLFDVVVDKPTAGTVKLRVLDHGGWRESEIKVERLHTRLLAEICSKTLRWVYFPLGSPAHRALLDLADKRLERISVLYHQQKNVLLNLTGDESSNSLAA